MTRKLCFLTLASLIISITLFSNICLAASDTNVKANKLRTEFDSKYQAWLEADARWWKANAYKSTGPEPSELPELQALIDMGPRITPFLIEKVNAHLTKPLWDNIRRSEVTGIITYIIAKGFLINERPDDKDSNSDTELILYADWWKNGRKNTAQIFKDRYDNLRKAQQVGTATQIEIATYELTAMGIDALPFIMKKIKAGEDSLIPAAVHIAKVLHKIIDNEKPNHDSVLKWWQENEAKLKFPDPPTDGKSK